MNECKQSIVLIGMPGVGKTTVGRILSEDFNQPFLDSDTLIQENENSTLNKIITIKGIDAFRRIEESYILKLEPHTGIIATGGSVVYSDKAMNHLLTFCICVFLDIKVSLLGQRLNDLDERGVVRSPGQTIEMIYQERTPLYQQYADLSIDTSHKTPDNVSAYIKKEVDLLLKKS